jgi:hypothetical protein
MTGGKEWEPLQRKNSKLLKFRTCYFAFVGMTGFEPATTWSQTRSATGLRYIPRDFQNRMQR